MTIRTPRLLLLAMTVGLSASAVYAEDRIMFVTGDVRIVDADGKVRQAQKGMEIRAGETIVSAPGGYAQALTNEGAYFAVMSDTKLQLGKLNEPIVLPAARNGEPVASGGIRILDGNNSVLIEAPSSGLESGDLQRNPVQGQTASDVPVMQVSDKEPTLLAQANQSVTPLPVPALPLLRPPLAPFPIPTLQGPIVLPPPPKPIMPVLSAIPPVLKLPPVLVAVTAINKPIGQQPQIRVLPMAVEPVAPAVTAQNMANQNTVMDAINTVTTVVKLNNAISAAQTASNTILSDPNVAVLANPVVTNTNTAITNLGSNLVSGVVNKQLTTTTANTNLGTLGSTATTAASTVSGLVSANPTVASQLNTLATQQATISNASTTLANTLPSLTTKTNKLGIGLR